MFRNQRFPLSIVSDTTLIKTDSGLRLKNPHAIPGPASP